MTHIEWDVDTVPVQARDVTDEVRPIRDVRTCREKQDEEIRRLTTLAQTTAQLTHDLVRDLEALRARVVALEAAAPVTVPILGSVDSATGAIRWTRDATPAGWRKVWAPVVTP